MLKRRGRAPDEVVSDPPWIGDNKLVRSFALTEGPSLERESTMIFTASLILWFRPMSAIFMAWGESWLVGAVIERFIQRRLMAVRSSTAAKRKKHQRVICRFLWTFAANQNTPQTRRMEQQWRKEGSWKAFCDLSTIVRRDCKNASILILLCHVLLSN